MNLKELLDGHEYGLFYNEAIFKAAPTKGFLIENLLYEGDVVCISSKAGVGKSILGLQLMAALSSGTPFLETFNVREKCNVLYIQTEGDRAETIERLRLMEKGCMIDYTRIIHLNLPGAQFNIKAEFDEFLEVLKQTGMQFDVIIIDPLYTTIKGNLNDNQVVTDWIRNMRALKGIFDCSIIILNHENKDVYYEGSPIDKGLSSVFGSTFWSAFFNHNYKLKAYDGHYILEVGKNRSGKAVDRVVMSMVNSTTLMYVPHDPDLSQNGIKIVSLLKQGTPVNVKKIVELTKVTQASTYRIIKRLVDRGEVVRDEETSPPTFSWKNA